MARSGGGLEAIAVDTLDAFTDLFARAMADDEPWVIVGKIESGDSPYRPSKNCVWLRDRFMAAL